jgi:3beta-hydroxy-delta5-steroid dehydrogenase/steroid delta-isomerase
MRSARSTAHPPRCPSTIAKAQRDLGYQPLFTTEQAMAECVPYYVDLFHQMKGEQPTQAAVA